MRTFEGRLDAKNKSFAIVAARFNEMIVGHLVSGAESTLKRHGVKDDDIWLTRVPGAFEIPGVARLLANSGKFAAVICLGTVIRGATPHFDYVAGGAANGISQIALSGSVPIIFGVLTTETIEQAIERAGTKAGNKGEDAATAAIEMASLYEELNDALK
jgi:6,7-dimethyl-8-ribityllumazine synthase